MNRGRRRTWSVPDCSAGIGGAVWLFLVARGPVGATWGAIELLVLLAVLVIVPLGMGLIGRQDGVGKMILVAASRIQPVAAVMVVASFWMPKGPAAALWISGWLLLSGLLAVFGAMRLSQRKRGEIARACSEASLLFLPIGAGWLAVSRAGLTPMGFAEPIVLLTAMHFHYAGFAAALYVGLALRLLGAGGKRTGRINTLAAIGVIAGTPVLAAGFVLAMWLKVAAAILLLGGLTVICIGVLRALPNLKQPVGQVLLAVSAVSALCGALPALVYVIGEAVGRTWIGIPTMAVSHGVLNGLGFALCGLLGWRILEGQPRANEHEG